MKRFLPEGKDFAFTIIDDTDNSTVENTEPVYQYLHELGIRSTKTAWAFPPRNKYNGESLQDEAYLDFLKDLKHKGFEIAFHNAGSGSFTREEIKKGLELFGEQLGESPILHVNHANNPDNIYWGYKRFSPPLRWLFALFPKQKAFYGESEKSPCFWGDLHKEYIRFTRNHVFNNIDTLSSDPKMPYRVKSKEKFSNYWFSSSDGHTVHEFNQLISSDNIDELEKKGGACIIYTHFASGFINNNGVLPLKM